MSSSGAFLALRHTSPPGLFPGAFAAFTKFRLVTRYPHSGIVIDGVLYEATFKNNVSKVVFNPAGWELFEITNVDKNEMVERFNQVEGARYDWFSLLAFVLPFRVTVARWLYCYELAWFMIDGSIPTKRITPETLLTLIR